MKAANTSKGKKKKKVELNKIQTFKYKCGK